MKLRKRLVANIMAAVLAASSLQFSTVSIYAEELYQETDEEIFETDAEFEMQEEGVSDGGAQGETLAGTDSDNQEDSKQTETDDTGNGTEDSDQFDVEKSDDEAESVVTALEEASVSENAVEIVLQFEIEEAELDEVYQFGGAPLGKTAKSGGSSFLNEFYSVVGEVNGVTIDEYIYQEALKRNKEIDISAYNIPTYTLRDIFSGVVNEHPELYFVDRSFSYRTNSSTNTAMTLFLAYNNSLDDVTFKAETKAALSTTKDGMSDLQKAIVLHDYLAVNCQYDETELENGTLPQESYSAYGALVNRTAVCQGYALAYKYLLNQAGIECYMVASDIMEHVWNLVKLDGQYYQVDVTWDDPIRDLIGRASHAYMFCSDNVFQDEVHGHYDWRVTYGSEVVDYQATDTKYDNAFWSDINSPLVLAGNNWDDCYYVCYDAGAMAGKIKRTTLSAVSNIGTDICNAGTWPKWEGGGFYTGAFSGLYQNGNRLYYNDKTSIYSVDFDGANKKTEFTADTANGYIYGSALCQGKVLYSLHQTPNFSEKETVLIADIDITMEAPSEIPVESITVSPATLELAKGKTAELEAVVTPANATDKNITWTSSDKSIAEVENGVVKAVASGKCTITASAGGKEAVCSVNVSESGSEDIIASGEYKDGLSNITWIIDSNGKLTVEGYGDFAVSSYISSSSYYENYKNRAPWYEYRDSILSAEINVEDMWDAAFMFYGCRNMTSADLANFDTSKISNMYGMFDGCTNLKSLDLSKFDTRNLKYMDYMFGNCRSLTDLDLSSFDTSKVSTMRSVFCGCSSLINLDVSSFDTRNVSDMSWMFEECSALTELNLSGFETKRGVFQYMFEMFAGCRSLTSLDLSGFDGASLRDDDPLQDTVEIFRDCDNLTTIYTPHDIVRGNYCLPIKSGDVWYMPDGSEITKLPGSSDSMIIARNEIPTIKNSYITATLRKTKYSVGTSIEMVGLIVKYYKNNGSVTIVDDYTTNADEIDMSTAGKKELVVTYNGLRAEVELTVLVIPVENIRIDKEIGNVTDKNVSTLVLESRGSVNLYATVKPLNATYSEILWSSSDESVAKVMVMSNNHVMVSAVASGKCTITASAGEKEAVCNVIVTTSQSKDDIAGGTFENVRWRIDRDGKLIVEGTGDFANSNSTNRAPWFTNRTSIKSAEINLTGTTNVAYMFYDCGNLTNIDVSKFDTSNVTDMTWTFRGCTSLTDLDLSSLDTGNVARMKWMFKGCSNLKSLNVTHFDTGNVVDMGGMFDGCSSLTSLDLSSFNTENVKYMNDKGGMFSDCSSLTTLDLSNFDTHNVVDMKYLFMNCKSLTSLDLSNFNTEKVTGMDRMFAGCNSLTTLDISSFNTRNVTSMSAMFEGCGLISLNLSNFDVENVTNFASFLNVGNKLSTIYTPCNLKKSVELPKGSNMDSDDLWYDIDGNTYTELPQNLTRSIVLTRNQKPVISAPHITLEKEKTKYVVGEKLNTDDLRVTYYNETGIPLKVSDYTTNANEIDMSTSGTKILVVTYQGMSAEIEIVVSETQSEETYGLKISFKNEQDKECSYTGSAIKPEIRVSYNGRALIEGSNYTVKYSNNIKIGNAKITVTGKGNFRSSKSESFKITQADINNAKLAGTDQEGRLIVVSGTKFAPIIYYGNQKLTAKDYTIEGTINAGKKITDSDSGKIIALNGKGNYTGSKEISLRVVRKSDLTKFTVTLDKTKLNALTYDGKAHYVHEIQGAVTVLGKDGNANMKQGVDYIIVYPANVTDAGTKKFSVIGMGLYTGTVSKSYTIKSAVNTNNALKVEYESGNIENIKLPYKSTGVTFNNQLKITYAKDGDLLTLREGKDYKVTYSGNKKTGNKAKFTISFLGNYKGIQKQTRMFTIEKADLRDAAVIIADAVYKKNPGIYKSVPYVIEAETGRLISASNYKVSYYIDETRNIEMKGKNKVLSGDTVYVKLEAKANSNYKSDMPIIKTYKVINAINLANAKVSFINAETETTTKTAEYTGNKITERDIKVLIDGKPADENVVITYANNIDKGKATVIITGTGKPGCKYTGCKKATFNIVAFSLR